MVTPSTSFAQVATAPAQIPIQAVQAIGPKIKSIDVKELERELLPRLVDALKAVFALRKDSTEEVTSTKLTLDINRENKKRKDDQRTPPEEKSCIEGSQPSFSQQKDTNMVKKPRGWPKVDKPKEVPATSNDSNTALATTSRPDRVEQATRNICFAQKTICSKVFYNVLPYPKENNTDSKKKRKKEYTPSVITSDKWVEYHEECERLKMEKKQEKQERKQARENTRRILSNLVSFSNCVHNCNTISFNNKPFTHGYELRRRILTSKDRSVAESIPTNHPSSAEAKYKMSDPIMMTEAQLQMLFNGMQQMVSDQSRAVRWQASQNVSLGFQTQHPNELCTYSSLW
ncbi:hypothetical protein RN001_013133 [Aquatica leii]|uniref:Uncharacterized protein n=1 Tax=Aquatica leii TaxID=1421715 RepID=A0AAN7P2B5_9COLE|nr:hypothetical protein RN001_013133 [Aquatica leii]